MTKVIAATLLFALVLALAPAHAEILYGDYTLGQTRDLSVKVDKTVWKFLNAEGNPSPDAHAFVSFRVLTTDVNCEIYRIMMRYRANGVESSWSRDVYAQRYSDLGYAGDNRQLEVRAGFSIPWNAEVIGFTVTKAKMTPLGGGEVGESAVPEAQRPPAFSASVGQLVPMPSRAPEGGRR